MWIRDSESLPEANMALLEEAAVGLAMCAGGWIAGNEVGPELVRASEWLDTLAGVIFATPLASCSGNTHHFAVVHVGLAHGKWWP